MIVRPVFSLPDQQDAQLKRAIRLEWWSIFFLLTIAVVMFMATGNSQAMRAAFIEDLISLVPPLSFLVANRIRKTPPSVEYPYGRNRATLLAFLAAAVAVSIVGLFILYEGISTLIKQDHPTIGHFYFLEQQWGVWAGWIMIVALTYSIIPPFILGRKKLPLAKDLHESTLYADAAMNKADWLTAGAAILGVLGIGLGIWWADAAAATIIGLDVLKDGFSNVKRAMQDLMDHRPADIATGKPLNLEQTVRDALLQRTEVDELAIRLRQEGRMIAGEVFILLHTETNVAEQIEQLNAHALSLDWRLHDLVMMPVTQAKMKALHQP
ncbi:MAG TPA: cation diffusion facilitator family transporter [Pseudomonas xinjiangensis]|uniref:Cation diffusion facilitator family transporter n=2 Tax=root TaxID=1 RepID=A0A7V1FTF6_9GAMM|nr:cation diffusion facilitator family transporter [Halopseudomonas xinjiangensis]HEC47443.1 cation diffusion facilitator family transporter [Halopseudomonas xinjiangensis]